MAAVIPGTPWGAAAEQGNERRRTRSTTRRGDPSVLQKLNRGAFYAGQLPPPAAAAVKSEPDVIEGDAPEQRQQQEQQPTGVVVRTSALPNAPLVDWAKAAGWGRGGAALLKGGKIQGLPAPARQAFRFFLDEYVKLVAAEAMDSQVALRAAATKDAHAKWEQLGEKGQAHFKELAKADKSRFEAELKEFRALHPHLEEEQEARKKAKKAKKGEAASKEGGKVSKKKKKTKAAAPSQDAGVADKPATGRRGKTQQRGDNGAAGAAKAVAKRQGRQKKEEEEARSGSSSEEEDEVYRSESSSDGDYLSDEERQLPKQRQGTRTSARAGAQQKVNIQAPAAKKQAAKAPTAKAVAAEKPVAAAVAAPARRGAAQGEGHAAVAVAAAAKKQRQNAAAGELQAPSVSKEGNEGQAAAGAKEDKGVPKAKKGRRQVEEAVGMAAKEQPDAAAGPKEQQEHGGAAQRARKGKRQLETEGQPAAEKRVQTRAKRLLLRQANVEGEEQAGSKAASGKRGSSKQSVKEEGEGDESDGVEDREVAAAATGLPSSAAGALKVLGTVAGRVVGSLLGTSKEQGGTGTSEGQGAAAGKAQPTGKEQRATAKPAAKRGRKKE